MQIRLVRDKEDGTPTKGDDYKYVLVVTMMDRLDELTALSMRRKDDKERAYEILADLTELLPCLSNTYLTTKREKSSMARHGMAQKRAAELANDKGSYFQGRVQEVHDEPDTMQ